MLIDSLHLLIKRGVVYKVIDNNFSKIKSLMLYLMRTLVNMNHSILFYRVFKDKLLEI